MRTAALLLITLPLREVAAVTVSVPAHRMLACKQVACYLMGWELLLTGCW